MWNQLKKTAEESRRQRLENEITFLETIKNTVRQQLQSIVDRIRQEAGKEIEEKYADNPDPKKMEYDKAWLIDKKLKADEESNRLYEEFKNIGYRQTSLRATLNENKLIESHPLVQREEWLEFFKLPKEELYKYYPEYQVDLFKGLLETNNKLYMALESDVRSRANQLVEVFVETVEEICRALDNLKVFEEENNLKTMMAKRYLNFMAEYNIKSDRVEDILLNYLSQKR